MRNCEGLAEKTQRRGANRRGGRRRDTANLEDIFTIDGEKFSDALEAQIASMDFGEGKWHLDDCATKHVTPTLRN